MSIFRQLYNNPYFKKATSFLRVIIPVVIFYYLFTIINLNELLISFETSDKLYLTYGIILGIISFVLHFIKWEKIVKALLSDYKSVTIIKSILAGYAIGLVTPFRAGELPGRSFGLKGNDVTSISMAVMFDKILNLAALLFAGSVCFALFISGITDYNFYLLMILPLANALSIFIIFAVVRGEKFGKYKFIQFLSKIEYLAKVKKAFQKTRQMNRKFFISQFLYSFAIFLSYSLEFVLFVLAFEGSGNFWAIYSAIGAVYFVKAYIGFLSFADIGIRESSAVYFLGLIGVSAAAALNGALLIFFFNLLVPAALGALVLIKKA